MPPRARPPHAQVHVRGDGTFSIDFYLERDDRFAASFAHGHATMVEALRQKLPTANERPLPFRFSRCAGCGFLVFTSRDPGERVACALCGASFTTAPLDGEELAALAAGAHEAIGRRVVSCRGQVLHLLVQASAEALHEPLGHVCAGFGFAPAAADDPAVRELLDGAVAHGALDGAARWSAWRLEVADDNPAYAGAPPPHVIRLTEWLRHVDPRVRTASG